MRTVSLNCIKIVAISAGKTLLKKKSFALQTGNNNKKHEKNALKITVNATNATLGNTLRHNF
jgi:hypothetical protein